MTVANEGSVPQAPRKSNTVRNLLLGGCGCIALCVVILALLGWLGSRNKPAEPPAPAAKPATAAATAPSEAGIDPTETPSPVALSNPASPVEIRSALDRAAAAGYAIRPEHTLEDARLLLIAAAYPRNAAEAKQALTGLKKSCGSMDECQTIRADASKVLRARLAARDDEVVLQAVRTAHAFLGYADTPDERAALHAAILRLVKSDRIATVRAAAIRELQTFDLRNHGPIGTEIIEQGLNDDDPVVLAAAMRAMHLAESGLIDLADAQRIERRLAALRKHSSQEVRAWAALATGSLFVSPARQGIARMMSERLMSGDVKAQPAPARDAAGREVAPMLQDPSPAVRAAAAIAIGRIMHFPSVDALAALLSDTASAEAEIAGTARAFDSPSDISVFEYESEFEPQQVRFATALAFLWLDDYDPATAFKCGRGDVAKSADCPARARHWYESHKGKLPAFE